MGGRGYRGLGRLLALDRRGGRRQSDKSLATIHALRPSRRPGMAGTGVRDFYPLALEVREGSAPRGLAKAGG